MSPALQYDSYVFKRTSFAVNKNGAGKRMYSKNAETILVAWDWQLHHKVTVPHGGYIVKGFSKYAFQVHILSQYIMPILWTHCHLLEQARLGTSIYALVQSKPMMSSEDMNKGDLIDELALMHLGQYFMDTFYARATFYNAKVLVSESYNIVIFAQMLIIM